MDVEKFIDCLGVDFYTGVPDSQLKALCNYLMNTYGISPKHHIIAANEGNCTALAAGYHLATGKIPAVYMQNSGEGNAVNPIASLLNKHVYAIPVIFIIGWRGEPGIQDEPQHIFQGEITLKLLDDMDIAYFIIEEETAEQEIENAMKKFRKLLLSGKSVSFVVRKHALTYAGKTEYKNDFKIEREEAVRHIVKAADKDPVIATTGKISRELFEIREQNSQSHKYDFLTVGSMGHASSIALGVAAHMPESKVWCIDGDGAAMMHMGAMAVIGNCRLKNLIHVILNNEAHETVGGMPTAGKTTDLCAAAQACGYPYTVSVESLGELEYELKKVKGMEELCLIEIKCTISSRSDLGRPTTTALENKNNFMHYLKEVIQKKKR